jgi:flagellar hook assembly protein FlgD
VTTNQFLTVTEKGTPGMVTAVEEDENTSGRTEGQGVPHAYTLSQNVSNPFNPETTIGYELPDVAEIRVRVTNLAGQEVRMLVQGVHQPGRYSVVWDGRDAAGQEVASGVYLYRLEVGGRGIVETKRMLLIR